MDKETLSNYGWIVICILVLSVMIALATPFGDYIGNAVKSTTQGLFDVQQKAMGVAGLVVDDQKFEDNGNGGADSNLITFYIAAGDMAIEWDTESFAFTAEKGMTWAEWCVSEYNLHPIYQEATTSESKHYCDDRSVNIQESTALNGFLAIATEENNFVLPTDTIIAELNYQYDEDTIDLLN